MATAPAYVPQAGDPLADPQLETAILAMLMCENGRIDAAVDRVAAEDFSEPLFGRLFTAIAGLAAQGKPANPVMLRPLFEADPALIELGGIRFLMKLTGDVTLELNDFPAHVTQLLDLSRRRHMRDGLRHAADGCDDMAVNLSEIVTAADAAMAVRGQSSLRQSTGDECLEDLLNSLDAPHDGVVCQHIPNLDELLGPLEGSQLIIMAGRPGMGKTAVALSYALGAAQAGHGVLFVSLEMNRQQLAGRMAADLCFDDKAIPYAAIRDRKLNDFQRRQVAQVHSKMRGVPFAVVDTGSLTPGRLGMIARRHDRRFRAQGHKLDLIVIDYFQLLRADSGTSKPYEAVSEVSRALKGLALDMDVPVLALAQLSREVEKRPDKRPQLSDLRDSGQIEQDADSVLFLLREEYYLHLAKPDDMDPKFQQWRDAMDEVEGKIEFILAKKRNGTTGTAFGEFHGAYQAVR